MEGTSQHFAAARAVLVVLSSLALLVAVGCQPSSEDTTGKVNETSGQQLANQPTDETPAPAPQQETAATPAQPRQPVPREYVPGPGPAPYEPHVALTAKMQALCPVGVGSTAPAFTLPTNDGGQASLSDLLGQRLTLLIFWKSDELYCVEQVARLERDVLSRYSGLGIEVVTVHVGEPTPKLEEILTAVQPQFPVLIDAQGATAARYAVDLYPRTYLLDAQGNILWFDLEYSRGTQRELDNAIRYNLLDSQ